MRNPLPYSPRSVFVRVSFAVAISASAAYGQNVDRVVLRNGVEIIGEIQELRRGTLSFDPDEMSDVNIDWVDIFSVTSNRIFEVTNLDGLQYFGRLEATDQGEALVVALGAVADTLAFSDVVRATYIGQGFFAKTNGFVDLGVNLARANSLASLLLNGKFAYRGRLWDVDWNGETYFQRQQTTTDTGDVIEEQTSRNKTSVTIKRLFGGSWAATTTGDVEQNEELSLDNRLLAILRGEYFIIRNQSMDLSIGLGGALNRETFTGEDRTSSVEIASVTNFDAFDIGDLNISTTTSSYYAPADGGRFRFNLDGRISWEIFNDFVIGFNATERYDSKPAEEDAGRDFHYSLTVGWSWG